MNLTLVRGVSGSGKSRLAHELAKRPNHVVIEADQFFVKDGVYTFNADRLRLAHQDCYSRVVRALGQGYSVIVSNTFTRRWEMAEYLALGVPTTILTVETNLSSEELAERCVHGLTAEQIQAQRDRWEETLAFGLKPE